MRKTLRLLSRLLLALILFTFGYGFILSLIPDRIPPLQNGDLVFQTTRTSQSMAIAFASLSPYIHTGIVRKQGDQLTVIEAANPVQETPLETWLSRGMFHRYSIYRYKDLTHEQGDKVVASALKYLGKPYDFYFTFDTEAIYCSELDYLAFKENDIPLAAPEKIGSLYVNNRFVKKVIEQRWQNYPACKGKDFTFEQCYDVMMEGELVTPAAIARDPHLELLYSNYPR